MFDDAETHSGARHVPHDRRLVEFPPPPWTRATPYPQVLFSQATMEAATSRPGLASRMAKMIVLGSCGVGKTALIRR
jgi:hypothetical protein